MEKIIVTADMMRKSSDYIPLLERQGLIEQIAQDVIAKVRMTYIPTGETEEQPMPDRFQENRVRTSLYLMGVLANKYLHVPFEGDDTSLMMPANLYDAWGESHVLNQIEGFRSDKELRDKAYNLLADYRDFRSALYREIETLLGHNNDIVWRLMDAIGSAAKAQAVEGAGGETANELTEEEKQARRERVAGELDRAIKQLADMKAQLDAGKGALANG